MKTLLSAAWLLTLYLFAFTQLVAQPTPGAELQAGHVHEYLKLRDLQVSPMMYVTKVNGIRINYGRITPKNQWIADISAGTGKMIAPALGIRQIKFSDTQEQPLFLIPTLYRGGISFTYRRKWKQTSHVTDWAGIKIQDAFNYADGLALTTWVMNAATVQLSYQAEIRLNKTNLIIAEASLPVLAVVSRMPYSNAISSPAMSNARAFLKNTVVESLNKYWNPQVNMAYRLSFSKRFALQAMYTYQWLSYTEPRLIRSASHTGNVSIIYQFQFQSH